MFYLGYVKGGKTTKAEGERVDLDSPKNPILNEFYVERELIDMGIECWLPKEIQFRRVGKQRRPTAFELPYLPNYIFIDIPVDRFLDVLEVKYLSSTLMALSRRDIAALARFRHGVDVDYAKAKQATRNQEAISEYVKGQKLRVMDDRFGEQSATFVAMIERAHDLFPKVKAEFEMMGQAVSVELDPLSVRAAE